jgi:hypothetical protein
MEAPSYIEIDVIPRIPSSRFTPAQVDPYQPVFESHE